MSRKIQEDMHYGEEFINRYGSKVKIIKYHGYENCEVIVNDDYVVSGISYSNLKRGIFKLPFDKVVHGVGFIGIGKYKQSIDTCTPTENYRKWNSMMERCYSKKYQKHRETYKGVEVCEEWHNFQNFSEWYFKNKISDNINYHLDKDFLSGKIYSPQTCILIPPQINISISNHRKRCKRNIDLPIGVSHKNGKFCVEIMLDGNKTIKSFSTLGDAISFYKEKKKEHLKVLADRYKNVITEKAYNAIIEYEIV